MSDVANRPGHIQYIRGHDDGFTGVLATTFNDVSSMNRWAEENPGYIVVEIKPLFDGSYLMLYTSHLTDEEKADLEEWGKQLDSFMQERRAAREASILATQEQALKEDEENARLREMGRKCEQNHKKDWKAPKKGKEE